MRLKESSHLQKDNGAEMSELATLVGITFPIFAEPDAGNVPCHSLRGILVNQLYLYFFEMISVLQCQNLVGS